jgi:hypothetical protein
VSPTVLNELDQKKYSAYDINISHRAQKIISKISEITTSIEVNSINKNLGFMCISKEPSIDWEKEGLSPQIPDDRIIASILEQKNNFKNLLLITSDIGLKLKASRKEIRCISLPDKYLLKIKKDKKQEEIEKLKNKITILENRLPILKLKILADNELSEFIKISLKKYTSPSEEEILKKVESIKNELKYEPSVRTNGSLITLLSFFNNVSENEIKRYEKGLDEYIKEMSKYYREEAKNKEFQSRLIELKFVIINIGNQPAEDIDIFIYFPDGSTLFSKDELPQEPEEPGKPILPRTQQELISRLAHFSIPNISIPNVSSIIPNISRNLSSGPKIRKTNSYEVRYDVSKLKHTIQFYLEPIYILFESIDLARSFKISYSILADNLPEPSNGDLNIVIL